MGEDLSLRDQLAALGVTSETLAALEGAASTVVSAMIERTTYRVGVATAGTDYTRGYAQGLSEIMAGIWHRADRAEVLRIQPAVPLPEDVDTVARLLQMAGAPRIVNGGPGWRLKLAPDDVLRESDISGVRGIRTTAGTIGDTPAGNAGAIVGDDEDDEDTERTCGCNSCDERGCDGDCELCGNADCDSCHQRAVESGEQSECCGYCSYCGNCHQCESGHDDNVYEARHGDGRYCSECEHFCDSCNHHW